MTAFVGQGEMEDSPDQLDPMVWALWDLFPEPVMSVPNRGDDQRLAGLSLLCDVSAPERAFSVGGLPFMP